MPRCLMATLATTTKRGEEGGGRHERGVWIPWPLERIRRLLGQDLLLLLRLGPSQDRVCLRLGLPRAYIALASQPDRLYAMHGSFETLQRTRGHQFVQTFHRTDIDTHPTPPQFLLLPISELFFPSSSTLSIEQMLGKAMTQGQGVP